MLNSFKYGNTKAPIAFASGNSNNCGLNSIIHIWFSLPDDIITFLYEKYPILAKLQARFCQTYELGEPTLKGFLAMKRFFKSPLDREFLWGDVLRAELRELAIQEAQQEESRPFDPTMSPRTAANFIHPNEIKYLENKSPIPHHVLRLLSEKMGATLIVNNMVTATHQYEDPRHIYIPANNDDAIWQAELFFTGGHYDFTFQDVEKNKAHNDSRGSEKSIILKGLNVVGEGKVKTDEFKETATKEIVKQIYHKLMATLEHKAAPEKERLSLKN